MFPTTILVAALFTNTGDRQHVKGGDLQQMQQQIQELQAILDASKLDAKKGYEKKIAQIKKDILQMKQLDAERYAEQINKFEKNLKRFQQQLDKLNAAP